MLVNGVILILKKSLTFETLAANRLEPVTEFCRFNQKRTCVAELQMGRLKAREQGSARSRNRCPV